MPDVDVLIPWRTDEGPRAEALYRLLIPWLNRKVMNGWYPVLVVAPDGPWSKGATLARASCVLSSIVVVHDADVLCEGLPDAIEAVRGGAAWAIPHGDVIRLASDGSVEEKHPGLAGGGIVVLTRKTFDECPMDPRFEGWGGEDESWACALTTLYGPPWRGDADLIHQWHPPAPRVSRRYGNRANEALRQRYLHANGHPDLMRRLVTEAVSARLLCMRERTEVASAA